MCTGGKLGEGGHSHGKWESTGDHTEALHSYIQRVIQQVQQGKDTDVG